MDSSRWSDDQVKTDPAGNMARDQAVISLQGKPPCSPRPGLKRSRPSIRSHRMRNSATQPGSQLGPRVAPERAAVAEGLPSLPLQTRRLETGIAPRQESV